MMWSSLEGVEDLWGSVSAKVSALHTNKESNKLKEN